MALKLLHGPKDQIWVPCEVTHRADHGKTYVDKFDVLIRTPAEIEDLKEEATFLRAAGAAVLEGEEAVDRVVQYFSENILGWAKLMDVDKLEIPFTPENLADLAGMTVYRLALVELIAGTRRAPSVAARKN